MSGLTTVALQLADLRGQPVAQATIQVADLLDDLEALVNNAAVDQPTALNLVTRALRSIRPGAKRPADAQAGLTELRQAVAEGPRRPGRPTVVVGAAHTIRVPDDVWAQVKAVAEQQGWSESRAAAELLAQAVRRLSPPDS